MRPARVGLTTGSDRIQLATWNFKTLISPERKHIETHFNFWLVPEAGFLPACLLTLAMLTLTLLTLANVANLLFHI